MDPAAANACHEDVRQLLEKAGNLLAELAEYPPCSSTLLEKPSMSLSKSLNTCSHKWHIKPCEGNAFARNWTGITCSGAEEIAALPHWVHMPYTCESDHKSMHLLMSAINLRTSCGEHPGASLSTSAAWLRASKDIRNYYMNIIAQIYIELYTHIYT